MLRFHHKVAQLGSNSLEKRTTVIEPIIENKPAIKTGNSLSISPNPK